MRRLINARYMESRGFLTFRICLQGNLLERAVPCSSHELIYAQSDMAVNCHHRDMLLTILHKIARFNADTERLSGSLTQARGAR